MLCLVSCSEKAWCRCDIKNSSRQLLPHFIYYIVYSILYTLYVCINIFIKDKLFQFWSRKCSGANSTRTSSATELNNIIWSFSRDIPPTGIDVSSLFNCQRPARDGCSRTPTHPLTIMRPYVGTGMEFQNIMYRFHRDYSYFETKHLHRAWSFF